MIGDLYWAWADIESQQVTRAGRQTGILPIYGRCIMYYVMCENVSIPGTNRAEYVNGAPVDPIITRWLLE